jgi:hypothetical protein
MSVAFSTPTIIENVSLTLTEISSGNMRNAMFGSIRSFGYLPLVESFDSVNDNEPITGDVNMKDVTPMI